MPRYRSHGQLDDPFIEDGDQSFRGLDAYTEPSLLDQGMVTESENIRFDRGIAKVRKGLSKVYDQSNICGLISFSDPDGYNDLLAITPTQLEGVIAQSRTPLALVVSVSSNATALQVFDNVYVFDLDKRPQKSDGLSAFTSLANNPPITDGTFIACPDAPFAHYIANRIVVPDFANSTTTIVCSDVLEDNQFQVSTGEFFLNKGTNDILFSIQSFQENQILCFCRSSIHLVNNLHSLDSASFEITRQFGISGTKAVCQNGSYYYFMSSEGDVQVLVPQSDPAKGLGIAISKITLDNEPLSKPITPLLEGLNTEQLNKTILHYHKNRVYVAACFGNEELPTTLLVYNSLLSMWESRDVLPIQIKDISSHGGKMYIASPDAVYEYESSIDDDGVAIEGKISTRDYVLGSRDIKRFVRGTIGYGSEQNGRTQIKVSTKTPDREISSADITEADTGFSRMQRFNARQRGYAANVEINLSSGTSKPSEVHRVMLEGIVANGRSGGDFDGN